jgi:MFS superfamily sulfate permease-like transporter
MATVVVLMVVFLATAPLAHLPQATLGATLVFISTKLFRAGQLRTILRFDRVEFALATATLVVVALVGIEQGVALAIVLSLADRTHRTARPRDAVLGRQPGTDHWIPVDIGEVTEKVPGVVVYLMYAPLWYGNADYFRARVRELVGSSTSPVHALVLDANAVSDIDYTGLQALKDVEDDLSRKRVAFAIARASHLVHHDLKHGALLRPLAGDHLFTSVDAAVEALKPPNL